MNIGSNNALTYLRPSSLLSRLFGWLGRCQEAPYDEQYTMHGSRFFDLRLFVNSKNHMVARNGSYTYDLFSLYEILDYFNKRCDVIVRITLDMSLTDDMRSDKQSIIRKFTETCRIIETIYEDVMLCGGYSRFDGSVLYEFTWEKESGLPRIVVPSETSWKYRFVTRYLPFLVGWMNRRYIREYYGQHGYLVLNYVNRR